MKNYSIKPPRILKWLLKRISVTLEKQSIAGDIEEEFHEIMETRGAFSAKIWYYMQLIILIPTYIFHSILWSIIMFKNYFKIALRNIRNQKIYSLINILGMAVSIAACIIILNYAGFELSYEDFHQKADNLYRLTNDRFQNGKLTQHGVITYPSVPKAMKADYPEVINFTRLDYSSRMYVRRGEVGFDERVFFADAAFFKMFSFPLLSGDKNTVLTKPYSVILSRAYAKKYFGKDWQKKGILGEVLNVDNRFDLNVTGVFENLPRNSHMAFDLLVSYNTMGKVYDPRIEDSWTNSNFMAYLELVPGTDPKLLERKFIQFSKRYFKGTEITGSIERFFLQPLKDIHLYSDYEYDEAWAHGNGTTVNALLIIAGFILLITWINYINLSTARALGRAREVGVRKVVGAGRTQIINQFFLESLLFNVAGLLLAVGIVVFIQPLFSSMLSIQFSWVSLTSHISIIFLVLFLLGTLVSGLYPAVFTSSYKAIVVLKGKLKGSSQGQFFRKALVIFQFALSFALIVGTYVVYVQINYMMDQDLGMNVDQTLVVRGPRLTPWDAAFFDNINNFKTELRAFPNIGYTTASMRLPGNRTGRIFNIVKKSGDSQQYFTTSEIGIDYDYFKTFEMEILAGRGFKQSDHNIDPSALKSIVINKRATELFGFDIPESAIGERLNFWSRDWDIIGVLGNHHQQSLHVPVEPIIFLPLYSTRNFFFVKVNTRDLARTIALVKTKYQEFFPGNSFSYFFLDEFFNTQYQSDRGFRTAFTLFSSLAVFLACLGLFGLSFFTAAQKTKEIGIRKVVGATTSNILGLLYRDFAKLILLAAVLASPLTYLAMNHWLLGFASRITIDWSMLAIPGLVVLIIALVTVSFQTIKAALLNPIDPLKYE
jgi:putative ABC transport system permease protein